MSHPLNTPLGRFGIVTSEEGPQRCIASIPAGGMINPLTGMPTIAPLAMLADHVGGLVNHHRRGPGEWTVSSELSLELAPDALTQLASAPELPVVATARPCGPKGPNALGLCEFTHRDSVVATATVRSFYIQAPGHLAKWPEGPTGPLPPGSLADRMAVRVAEGGGAGKVLVQDPDPVLNNSLGIVHGGVSAMALELVRSAAVTTAARIARCTRLRYGSTFCASSVPLPMVPNHVMSERRCGSAAAAVSQRPERSTPTARRRSSPA
jgi:hypothetical protein